MHIVHTLTVKLFGWLSRVKGLDLNCLRARTNIVHVTSYTCTLALELIFDTLINAFPKLRYVLVRIERIPMGYSGKQRRIR